MPAKKSDQFEDAVKPALESLLSDLQKTTEVLRRGQRKGGADEKDNAAVMEPPDYTAELRLTTATAKSPTSNVGGAGRGIGGGQQSSPAQKQLRELSESVDGGAAAGGGVGGFDGQSPNNNNNELSRRDPMLEGDKLGIHTIPKGDCPQCGEAVIGPVVIALGRMWHPDHFCCAHCHDPIGHRNFFERQGKAYCETDYHDMFSARCNYCNGPIKERCVTALGKTFHVEHFVCVECGRQFGDEGFHERSNNAYCKDCFYRQYAPKCQGCKQPITHKFITALSTHWHPECFCCQDCARPFSSTSLFDRAGRLLCEMCFHKRQGSICAQCHFPIAGRCVSALGRKFHPEHFYCCYCSDQIGKGTFKELAGRPYCLRCYRQTANWR